MSLQELDILKFRSKHTISEIYLISNCHHSLGEAFNMPVLRIVSRKKLSMTTNPFKKVKLLRIRYFSKVLGTRPTTNSDKIFFSVHIFTTEFTSLIKYQSSKWNIEKNTGWTETYLDPSQTSKVRRLAKIFLQKTTFDDI